MDSLENWEEKLRHNLNKADKYLLEAKIWAEALQDTETPTGQKQFAYRAIYNISQAVNKLYLAELCHNRIR